MILPFNKIGFRLKERSEPDDLIKSKRYFYLSPFEKRLYLTHNEKMLKSALYSSENEEEVINKLKLQDCKSMKLANSEIEKVKELYSPIHPSISSTSCFEMKNNGETYFVFAFFDEEISALRETFNKAAEKAGGAAQLPILPLLMPHTCNNKEVLYKFCQKFRIVNDKRLFSLSPVRVVSKDNQMKDLMELSNGSQYTGETLNGMPHGSGSEFRRDGVSYKGKFFAGKWHGEGVLFLPSLEYWEGEFMDGFPVSL